MKSLNPITSNFKELVERLHHQKETKSSEFKREIQKFQGISEGFVAKEKQKWRKLGLIQGPINRGYYNIIHHFSGDIEGKDKILFFMLNPRLGNHIEREYELEEQIGYWEFSKKKYSYIQDYGQDFAHNQWTSMKAIGQLVGHLVDEIPKNYKTDNINEIWQLLDNHVVIIDIIPFFSLKWKFNPADKHHWQTFNNYFHQTMTVFSDTSLLPSPRYIFFLGKIFRESPILFLSSRKKMWSYNLPSLNIPYYILNFPYSFYGEKLCSAITDYFNSQTSKK